jgi:hypothetical protein
MRILYEWQQVIKQDKIELCSLLVLIILIPIFYVLVGFTWGKINTMLVFAYIPLGVTVIRRVFFRKPNPCSIKD